MITGSSGFIGTNILKYLAGVTSELLIGIDKHLPYQSKTSKNELTMQNNYVFHQLNIKEQKKIYALLIHYQPRAIIHLAAETHVDKSIHKPNIFINNNIVAAFLFIQSVSSYWQSLSYSKKNNFLFLNVSTDEVFGDLNTDDQPIKETSPYQPQNPYAATKASADHILRAWKHTFKFPSIVTHCTNNYGPFQKPDKFIPKVILNALTEKSIPIYGNGMQSRDWLYVCDHCCALHLILEKGISGESYNIGANNEIHNISIVKQICKYIDRKKPRKNGKSYEDLIKFVTDRPGHDFRYRLNFDKIRMALDWTPSYHFQTELQKTIDWYISNKNWLAHYKTYSK